MRLAIAIVLLTGCGAALPQAAVCAPQVADEQTEAREPPPTERDAIDVDATDRGATRAVRLVGRAGTLMVQTGDAPESLLRYSEGVIVEPTESELDRHAHESWDSGDTVLAARTTAVGDDGTPGGWIGATLPWAADRGVAVRSWSVDWAERGIGDRDDELVVITFPAIEMHPVYVPGGRLRLLGLIAGHAIVVVSARDDTHRLVAVSIDGEEVASQPITPAPDLLDQATEIGLPFVGPDGADGLALACDDEVCVARFDGSTFVIEHTNVAFDDGFVLDVHGLHVARGDRCRWLHGPPRWASCSGVIDASWGLPVDGALALGASGDALVTEVRDAVALAPDAAGDEVLHDSLPGVVLVSVPEGGATDVTLDAIVRAEHVAISYTRVDDSRIAPVRRDLALAVPPGSVEATPLALDGRAAWRVRVHTTFPIHSSHDCWQGYWVVRGWTEGGGDAFATAYTEYGYCE